MTGPGTKTAIDVFGVAEYFGALHDSRARAIAPQLVEWQCRTWGSGKGGGDWEDTAVFRLVAQVFGLDTSRNWDGRDELIVMIPAELFGPIAGLIERLGVDEPCHWPWLVEEDQDRKVIVAAAFLGLSVAVLENDEELLEALHLE
jgi:hypothetical protein